MAAPAPLICHIIYRLAVGGLENGVVNLINRLPGDYAHAVFCVTEATEFRRRITRPGVEIFELRKRPGKDVAAYGRMWRSLRRLKPRIVHTRNLPALDMLAPARLAGVPRLVHSEHGRDMVELEGRHATYNRLRRMSRSVVDRYIAVSRDLRDWLKDEIGVSETRLDLIYNGVDTERFAPGERATARVLPSGFAPSGTIVFGMLGRLETVKNPLGLVHAFLRIIAMRPALRAVLRLVIVGDGSERGAIDCALAEANAQDLAWISDFREDTPDLYRALDVFVLPSLREGISNTLLEAMASGRPVVAGRVGGNPEIVPENRVGRLVNGPHPETLAAAMLDYVDHPELLRAHGAAARAHVQRSFSLDAMVANYDSVYRALL